MCVCACLCSSSFIKTNCRQAKKQPEQLTEASYLTSNNNNEKKWHGKTKHTHTHTDTQFAELQEYLSLDTTLQTVPNALHLSRQV